MSRVVMVILLCIVMVGAAIRAEACVPCEGGFYNDWNGQIYTDPEECTADSMVTMWGTGGVSVPMTKRDLVFSMSLWGAIISGSMLSALFKAVL